MEAETRYIQVFGYAQAFGIPNGATQVFEYDQAFGYPTGATSKRLGLQLGLHQGVWIPNRGYTQVFGAPNGLSSTLPGHLFWNALSKKWPQAFKSQCTEQSAH